MVSPVMLQLASSFIFILPVLWFLRGYTKKSINQFPTVGSPDDQSLAEALIEGYRKYPDSPFIIPTSPKTLILPMSLFKEAMQAPRDQFSFKQNAYDLFQGRYTYVASQHDDLLLTIRSDLTKSIPSILPMIQEETEYGLDMEFGDCAQWKPVPLFPMVLRLMALMSGRVFIGLPLSRDEEWIKASLDYMQDVIALMHASQKWNHLVRPFVIPFLSEYRKVRRDLSTACRMVRPVVAEAISRETTAAEAGTRGSFISWMLKYQPGDRHLANKVGNSQMAVSFVANSTTAMTATFVLLDMCTRPEYIKPLRDEMQEAIQQDGWNMDNNGVRSLTKATFTKMTKLDSFIKESQRLNPLSLAIGLRTVLRDTSFSNGLELAKGTVIAWSLWGIYNSTSTYSFSPEMNTKAGNAGPEVFDGFRFERLRNLQANGAKHHTVTTSEESLNFGHGPGACPGRFFAIYEIKTLLVNILLNYDIRLKEGVKPQNMVHHVTNNPDFTAVIEVRNGQGRSGK